LLGICADLRLNEHITYTGYFVHVVVLLVDNQYVHSYKYM